MTGQGRHQIAIGCCVSFLVVHLLSMLFNHPMHTVHKYIKLISKLISNFLYETQTQGIILQFINYKIKIIYLVLKRAKLLYYIVCCMSSANFCKFLITIVYVGSSIVLLSSICIYSGFVCLILF